MCIHPTATDSQLQTAIEGVVGEGDEEEAQTEVLEHLEDLRMHLHWLRKMLRTEEDGLQKALEAGAQVLFPSRHVENKRGLVDGYDAHPTDATFTGSAAQFSVVFAPVHDAKSGVPPPPRESGIRRNVVR
jgi:hypothetical protein